MGCKGYLQWLGVCLCSSLMVDSRWPIVFVYSDCEYSVRTP